MAIKKVKKAKPKSVKYYDTKIWKLCRELAFKMYKTDCYTCRQSNLTGANCQLGHMWAKASLSAHLKYDMRILRWQCWRCNCNLGGMGAEFYARMLREKGQEYMDALEKERQILIKADSIFYENKIKEYEDKLRAFL
jgi:hypothetical protein